MAVTFVLVSALILSLFVKTFVAQGFLVPSGSMEPTLDVGDKIIVDRVSRPFRDIRRGDVVVFVDPGGWLPPSGRPTFTRLGALVRDGLTFVGLIPVNSGTHLVKRVIAVGGDHVRCAGDGRPVTVNGRPLVEPYLAPETLPSEIAFDVEVPPGMVWVMGDNRQNSADSRYNPQSYGGAVPESLVVGRVVAVAWPISGWRRI